MASAGEPPVAACEAVDGVDVHAKLSDEDGEDDGVSDGTRAGAHVSTNTAIALRAERESAVVLSSIQREIVVAMRRVVQGDVFAAPVFVQSLLAYFDEGMEPGLTRHEVMQTMSAKVIVVLQIIFSTLPESEVAALADDAGGGQRGGRGRARASAAFEEKGVGAARGGVNVSTASWTLTPWLCFVLTVALWMQRWRFVGYVAAFVYLLRPRPASLLRFVVVRKWKRYMTRRVAIAALLVTVMMAGGVVSPLNVAGLPIVSEMATATIAAYLSVRRCNALDCSIAVAVLSFR